MTTEAGGHLISDSENEAVGQPANLATGGVDVEVDVGQGRPLRAEEALEDQVVAQRAISR